MSVLGGNSIWRDSRSIPLNEQLLDTFESSFDNMFAALILNISIITFTNHGCESLAQEDGWAFQRCPGADANWTFPIMNFSNHEPSNAVAAICSFYPCVRDYAGFVRDTVVTETAVNETPIKQPMSQLYKAFPECIHLYSPYIIDNQTHTLDNISSIPTQGHNFTTHFINGANTTFPTDCAYGVYAMGLGAFMAFTMNRNCVTPSRIDFNGDADDYITLVCDPWQLKTLLNKGLASFNTIDRNMQSIAMVIKSEMRK